MPVCLGVVGEGCSISGESWQEDEAAARFLAAAGNFADAL